jgi:hypothetical protein
MRGYPQLKPVDALRRMWARMLRGPDQPKVGILHTRADGWWQGSASPGVGPKVPKFMPKPPPRPAWVPHLFRNQTSCSYGWIPTARSDGHRQTAPRRPRAYRAAGPGCRNWCTSNACDNRTHQRWEASWKVDLMELTSRATDASGSGMDPSTGRRSIASRWGYRSGKGDPNGGLGCGRSWAYLGT